MEYFPALTIPNQEQVFVNLGERPFKFPVVGATPIVACPTALINYFKQTEQSLNLLLSSQMILQANVSYN